MYLLFGMLCLLLLAFDLHPLPLDAPLRRAHVWKRKELALVRILPQDAYVLIDGSVPYRYVQDSKDTYVSAVRLDTHEGAEILNHRYVLDWIAEPPFVLSYPSGLGNDVDVLNYLSRSLGAAVIKP